MCALRGQLRNLNGELGATAGIPGNDTQVFVIRIRIVHREIPGAPVWRGEIEHLNTGKKAYLKALAEIILFIGTVLREMGLEIKDPGPETSSWWARIKTFLASVFRRQKPKFGPGKKRSRLRLNKE